MKRNSAQASGPRRHRLRLIGILGTIIGAIALWLLDQGLAAAMLLVIGLLVREIERRDQRAVILAQWIGSRRCNGKIEVQHGEWGELSRAINALLQEQRIQQHVRRFLPSLFADRQLDAVLNGAVTAAEQTRPLTILLVGHGNTAMHQGERGKRATLLAWKMLAQAAHEVAQQHGAMLQSCGDAIMLCFGAVEQRSLANSIHEAFVAAAALQHKWRSGGINAGGPLVLSITSGHALSMVLPGLGYSIVGTPVAQAIQLRQQALHARHSGLICSEEVYHLTRHINGNGMHATQLRIVTPDRPPQIIYSWHEQHSANVTC